VQRLIAKLLTCWMLLLVPGATALELMQPQMLLPICCRTAGAHHCSSGITAHHHGPSWRSAQCKFAHLSHAAILLAPYLPVSQPALVRTPQTTAVTSASLSTLAAYLAGLPGSRAPPSLA
jgi:hypothetical protein